MLLSRCLYYLSSFRTLLRATENWPTVLAMFLGLPMRTPVVVELRNGCRFRVRTCRDIWTINETCVDRDYERNSVDIEDGWTVLDIGAFLGDFAICVARKHRQSMIYAYEPFPESFELLQMNVALNRVPNVQAFQAAITARSGFVDLHIASGDPVQHSTAAAAADPTAEAIRVPSITLDEVFRERGLSRCDFLKMDCEGEEYNILFQASKETLRRVRHLCVEYHDGVTPFSHLDLVRFLEDAGFHVATHPSRAHSETVLLHASNAEASVQGPEA